MAPDAQPQPRPPERLGPAAALALLVHAALLVALTVSVDWHSSEPEAVSAELWAAVPQVAAPPPAAEPPPPAPEPKPEPKPAPPPPAPPKAAPERDADIATERAERRKREEAERQKREAEQRAAEKKAAEEAERKKAKAEAERKEKAEAERRERDAQRKAEQQKAAEQKAEAQRLEKLRQDQLKRMQNSLGGSGAGSPTSTGTAARDAGPSASYGGKLRALIRENIVFADAVTGNPVAEVEVRAGPTGTIIARRLVKSSGVPAWDEAVLRAIDRIGTLPRDVDGRVPPTLVVTSRPKD